MKSIVFMIVLAVSGMFAAVFPTIEFEEKESMILDAVVRFMDAYHFFPQEIDNSYSEQAYELYLDALDGRKRFLIQSEVDELEAYKTMIDDQINNRTLDFFNRSNEILDIAHARAKNIYDTIKEEDFDINGGGQIEMDPDKRDHPQSEEDLTVLWKNMMVYDLIGRVNDKVSAQQDSTEQLSIDELKVKSKKDMIKSYDEWFGRIEKTRRSDRFEMYINTITHVADPHSDYFNPKEKEDFDINMGGKLEGIGARLTIDGDYTKIKEIIPGGPAWKGKELEAEDLITSVRQDKDEEGLDIIGMRLDDVVQKIRGKKGTIVHLTIKKPDGTVKTVKIIRDEVIIDEGFAKSLLLDIPGEVENIGYIRLPKFYDSFDRKNGNSCAKDVGIEIEKLKDNNVNGIILDLRNNGGGSLRDVVTMSGLFIEEGPIVQVKPREKKVSIYADTDDDVQYDGPLIVMVNQFSASASEILAAALQDYKRAVIVGSPSTFGKGTVQRFVNLDDAFRGADDKFKPLGNLKITMQKFYRINGGSTQLKGVNPDIILPNDYHYIETGEKDYENPLEWTEIEAVKYGQNIYTVDNLTTLKNNSEARIADNENFDMVLKNAERLKSVRDQSSYTLNFEEYKLMMEERKVQAEKFDSLYDQKIDNLVVNNLPEDADKFTEDDGKKERNEKWLKNINEDFHLEETLYIMRDLTSDDKITQNK